MASLDELYRNLQLGFLIKEFFLVCIVDSHDTGLAGDSLRGPCVVALFETERAELLVSSAGSDQGHSQN